MYRTLGRLDEALAAAQRATTLAPADPLCLHNQAIIHYHRVNSTPASTARTQALRIDPGLPGAHFVRAEALLQRGELAEGWEEYEWRFRIGGAAPLMPPTDKPQWDGTPFAERTLLLIADQGFGDAIQFCRYIPWVERTLPRHRDRLQRRDWRRCCAQIAPRARICSSAGRIARTMRRSARCPACRGWHGTRVENVPAPIPYLHADPARVGAVEAAAGRPGAARASAASA